MATIKEIKEVCKTKGWTSVDDKGFIPWYIDNVEDYRKTLKKGANIKSILNEQIFNK